MPLGGFAYFSATTREMTGLWRTDGTSAGTTFLEPGYVYAIARLGDRIVYSTDHGLRATDGITPVTISAEGYSSDLTELNGRLLFSSGSKVWITDGTAERTRLVWTPASYARPTIVGRFGDRVAFVGEEGLFLTDGTSGGTMLLSKQVVAAGRIVVAGGQFFFAGTTSTYDPKYDLWVSDGTAAGTHITKHISSVNSDTAYMPLAAAGDRALFVPYEDFTRNVWISDGTAAGTVPLKKLYAGAPMVTINGIAYFPATEQTGTDTALWRSDGTAGGTQRVGGPPNIRNISVTGGRMWITTGYESGTQTLWISDGTTSGTRLLAPIGSFGTVVPFNGRFIFDADDGTHGDEPWWSDGTPEGTSIIADIAPNLAPSSDAQPVIATANRVLFKATDDMDRQLLWSSDGTASGTMPADFKYVGDPVRFGDLVYFYSTDYRLMATDGTPARTRVVKNFGPLSVTLVPTAGTLYVFTQTGLYTTDGTAPDLTYARYFGGAPVTWTEVAGHLVFGSNYDQFLEEVIGHDAPRPIIAGRYISSLSQAGGRVFYFQSSDLFTTDGTTEGVMLLKTFGYDNTVLGAVGNRLLFAADDGVHGKELWSSDGTAAGTQLVKDIWSGSHGSSISGAAVLDGRIVFTADDGLGLRLWSSDGTPEGTMLIGAALSSIGPITAAKGLAFFRASDGVHGGELWQSDGTAAGTQLVADIYPGAPSSDPGFFAATRDTLFFQATTPENGVELWALPIPWRTIAISDARVTATATTATMSVALDAASSHSVTATWTSATGATGTIAFAPGETQKTISFPVASDPKSRSNRMIYVRLSDVRGAVATKSFASVIVERGPASADLRVSIRHSSSGNARQRDVIVTNLGPDSVPEVLVFAIASRALTEAQAATPTIPVGASAPAAVDVSGIVPITVTGTIADPNPTNNTTTILEVHSDTDLSMSIVPVALHAGMHATLTVAGNGNPAVQLSSSDPSVIAVPASVPTPADLDVVALAPGTTTITASTPNGKTVSFDLSVVAPDATYRWASRMTFTIDVAETTFGTPRHLVARLAGNAWDAADVTPTGAVTFTEGSKVLAVAHVDPRAVADTIIDSFLPGTHTITATYEGDAHFFAASATAPPVTVTGAIEPTFIGMVRPLTDTTAEITITVVAPRAAPPTGTITLRRFDQVLAKDIPVIDGKAVAVTSKELFVTVDYSGDALYPPTIQSINLVPARHRAAP